MPPIEAPAIAPVDMEDEGEAGVEGGRAGVHAARISASVESVVAARKVAAS